MMVRRRRRSIIVMVMVMTMMMMIMIMIMIMIMMMITTMVVLNKRLWSYKMVNMCSRTNAKHVQLIDTGRCSNNFEKCNIREHATDWILKHFLNDIAPLRMLLNSIDDKPTLLQVMARWVKLIKLFKIHCKRCWSCAVWPRFTSFI